MPPPSTDLGQLGFLLGRAYYSYIGMLERWLDESDLLVHVKPGMGSLLFSLFQRDDRTIGEVAEELQLARSTMTGMVDRMKRAGLICVVRDAADKRALRLQLTPLAKRLEPRCRQLADRVEKMLCQGMSAKGAEQLRRALAAMIRAINVQISRAPVSRSVSRSVSLPRAAKARA